MGNILEEIRKATKELAKADRNYRDELRKMESLLRKTTELADLIIAKDDPKALVIISEGMGLYLMKSNITSSQLRNIFGYTKKIDGEVRNTTVPLDKETIHKLMLLSPKLAYVAGREGSRGKKIALELLRAFFDDCIERVGEDSKKFKRFIDLFESILSYHKFYGAK